MKHFDKKPFDMKQFDVKQFDKKPSGMKRLLLRSLSLSVPVILFGGANTCLPAGAAEKEALLEGEKAVRNFSGYASWYGKRFHGRRTASGEIFNMNKMTAAHKSLPFQSRVIVEDPRSGNAVMVKVNDRGPYAKNRVMDLSREAARRLGTLSRGVFFIEVTLLD